MPAARARHGERADHAAARAARRHVLREPRAVLHNADRRHDPCAEDADTLAYRATLAWLPLDKIKATIRHDFAQEKGTGYTGSNFRERAAGGPVAGGGADPRAVIYRGPQRARI